MNKTIWLTSDTHFFHEKPFIFEARGFNNIQEMNNRIIENWNSMVKENDIVYHLGDVFLDNNLAEMYDILKSLKGKKYLAYGNHDTDNRLSFFKEHKFFEEINMGYRINAKKLSLVLSHYPMFVANKEDKKPIWTIHGHTHQTTKFNENVFHGYHVGVDSNNCHLINLEEMVKEIKDENKIN